MEVEFEKLYAEAVEVPDHMEPVPSWPASYTLHDAAMLGDPVALETIMTQQLRTPPPLSDCLTVNGNVLDNNDDDDSDTPSETDVFNGSTSKANSKDRVRLSKDDNTRPDCLLNININARDDLGRTPLFYAVLCQDEDRASECTSLLCKDPYCDVRVVDNAGDTPAHVAEHASCMSILAGRNAMLGVRDSQERTPLMRAAERNNVDVVALLVRSHNLISECDVDAIDNQMNSALTIACKLGHASIVSLLLPHSSFLKRPVGQPPPIICAVRGRHLECIRLIATRGPEALQQRDMYNWSALHHAAYQGHEDTVSLLQELTPMLMPIIGGPRDKRNRRRRKKLRRRSRLKNRDKTTTQTLLETSKSQDSTETKDENHQHAVPVMATDGGGEQSIAGASPGHDSSESEDDDMPTPLDLAVACGHVHIVDRLIPKNQKRWGSTCVAVAIGKSGSQYGVYSSYTAALPVLTDSASFQAPDFSLTPAQSSSPSKANKEQSQNPDADKKSVDLGKRVVNFRLFRTKDQWEAATEYVQMRSYAKKRDEDHVARLEQERIEAEKEAARRAEEKRLRKERRAKRRAEREQRRRLKGSRGGRRRRGRSKSPPSRLSSSPEKRGRSKSPDKNRSGRRGTKSQSRSKSKGRSSSPQRRGRSKSPQARRGQKHEERRKETKTSESPSDDWGHDTLSEMASSVLGIVSPADLQRNRRVRKNMRRRRRGRRRSQSRSPYSSAHSLTSDDTDTQSSGLDD